MSGNPNKLTQFWQELKRRKVIYVITVYASASFVLIELINNVSEPLNLPQGLSTIAIVVLAIGFPFAVVLSWIFDVTPKGVEKTKPSDEIPEEDKTATPNSWRIATLASFVVIVGLISFNLITRTKLTENLSLYGKSIAVLPFINDGTDSEENYIDGTMGAIIGNLSLVKELIVINRRAVERYRDNPKPIQEIAKEMRVGYLLEGSGEQYRRSLILNLRLVDADNNEVWSGQYAEEIRNIEQLIAFRSKIVLKLAEEIGVQITSEERLRIEKIPTTNKMAMDLRNIGGELVSKYRRSPPGQQDVEDLERAKSYFLKGLEYDSTYSGLYFALADAYQLSQWSSLNNYLSENYMDSVLIYANMALSWDSQSGAPYFIRAMYYADRGDIDASLENYNQALEINPNFALAFQFRGNLYNWSLCDHVKAIEDYENAYLRNEGGLILPHHNEILSECYELAGYGELGKPYLLNALEFTGDSARYYSKLAKKEQLNGNFDAAIKLGIKAYEIDTTRLPDVWNFIFADRLDEAYMWARKYVEKEDWFVNWVYGYAYWEAGEHEQAKQLFDRILEFFESIHKLKYGDVVNAEYHNDAASIYAFRGEKEKAYQLLEEYVHSRGSVRQDRVLLLKYNPMYNDMRDEKRFQKLLQELEDKFQAEHERFGKWLEETGRL